MNIGEQVRVEFIGEVVKIERFATSGVLVSVKIDDKNTVSFVPVGACSPLQEPETPIVGGDGSC